MGLVQNKIANTDFLGQNYSTLYVLGEFLN